MIEAICSGVGKDDAHPWVSTYAVSPVSESAWELWEYREHPCSLGLFPVPVLLAVSGSAGIPVPRRR